YGSRRRDHWGRRRPARRGVAAAGAPAGPPGRRYRTRRAAPPSRTRWRDGSTSMRPAHSRRRQRLVAVRGPGGGPGSRPSRTDPAQPTAPPAGTRQHVLRVLVLLFPFRGAGVVGTVGRRVGVVGAYVVGEPDQVGHVVAVQESQHGGGRVGVGVGRVDGDSLFD